MQSLILKLQADVDARKHRRSEAWPVVRAVAIGTVIFVSAFLLGARTAESPRQWAQRATLKDRALGLNAEVDALRGELDIKTAQVERLQRAYDLSTRYGIGADLALMIEEIAMAENVDPKLAFELVRVESGFNQHAVSPVGAVGYTQLMPATARILSPGITRRQMFDRETNLRLGFRFFRSLLDHYDGNVRLALLAYNRGPTTVDRLLAAGVDPGNGYAKKVMGQ